MHNLSNAVRRVATIEQTKMIEVHYEILRSNTLQAFHEYSRKKMESKKNILSSIFAKKTRTIMFSLNKTPPKYGNRTFFRQ